jgi:DNA-binding CsgD family transcriptional regulator
VHSRDVQLSLMQALLAAPGSTAGWEAFLSELCDALHGSAAKFIAHSMESTDSVSANVSVTVRVDPSAVADYERYWCRHDPWRDAMSPRVLPGEVLLGDSLIEPARITRTAFHNDFAVPYDTTQCLAGILEASPRRISNISVNRGENARRFDEDDATLLRVLMPSLSRALEVHRRLCGAELMAAHSLAALDRLRDGVLLIAQSGRILQSNQAAKDILTAADGLTTDHGELRAATPALTTKLRTLLNAAMRTRNGEALDGEATMALPRPSGRRPLTLLIAALPSASPLLASTEAAAAIFVSDPEQSHGSGTAGRIRALFGLTVRESELVQLLASGLTLEEAAAGLDLALETVRSRLKVIFQKTNTRRQAELVRLVLTTVAGFR